MNTVTKASIPLFQHHFVLTLFLLVFSLSLYTFKLGDCPFFNPDEGIHAQVAKSMVVNGNSITPGFNSCKTSMINRYCTTGLTPCPSNCSALMNLPPGSPPLF